MAHQDPHIDYALDNPHDTRNCKFGVIVLAGDFAGDEKLIYLTQQAYLDGTHENPCYRAHAKDADDNAYLITWDVLDGWQDQDDESECCDWDVFTVKEL